MRFLLFLSMLAGLSACNNNPGTQTGNTENPSAKTSQKPADAKTIIARKQVPILCYHQIRDWRPGDSETAKVYIVPPATFREQMKMLADSGYQTILPDQLIAYLETGLNYPLNR